MYFYSKYKIHIVFFIEYCFKSCSNGLKFKKTVSSPKMTTQCQEPRQLAAFQHLGH